MDETAYLLICLAEECAEVQQRIAKALRFGLGEIQPEQELTNEERLVQEFTDLLAVADVLHNDKKIFLMVGSRAAKKKKLRKHMSFSRELGILKHS